MCVSVNVCTHSLIPVCTYVYSINVNLYVCICSGHAHTADVLWLLREPSFSAHWKQLALPTTSQGGPWLPNKGTEARPLGWRKHRLGVQFVLQVPRGSGNSTAAEPDLCSAPSQPCSLPPFALRVPLSIYRHRNEPISGSALGRLAQDSTFYIGVRASADAHVHTFVSVCAHIQGKRGGSGREDELEEEHWFF